MDDVILSHSGRSLKLPANCQFIQKQVVQRTYGFDYDRHFRQMLIRLIGITGTERMERKMDVAVHARFEAELRTLKTIRDTLAHTYAKNFPPIDSPARTRTRFEPLYNGLKSYDDALRELR
jgi:hypothetical protein